MDAGADRRGGGVRPLRAVSLLHGGAAREVEAVEQRDLPVTREELVDGIARARPLP